MKRKKKVKAAGNQQILVRLPVEIQTPLQRDASKRRCTVQAVLLSILATHYGLDVAPPKRGARKKPAKGE
jgi:hypothetical protein